MNPLRDMKVTSPYGRRDAPIKGASTSHSGVDLKANYDKTYAVADGIVAVVSQWDPGIGKFIIIDHGDYQTTYGHLSDFKVEKNKVVKEGDLIGTTGNSGNSEAPHLHFEVRVGKYNAKSYWAKNNQGFYDHSVDPMAFLESLSIKNNESEKNMILQLGSKGEPVTKLQTKLKSFGYNISIDGHYGNGTRNVVIQFQRDHKLIPDGIAGPQTQGKLYESSDGELKTNGTTKYVEINPLDLKLHIEDNTGKKINLKRFINGSFVWWANHPKMTGTYATSLLVYDGKIIKNSQPNGWPWQSKPHFKNGAPVPTMIVYKSGKVEVADKSSFTQKEANLIHIAFSGIGLLPYVRTQGFSPYVSFYSVAYRTQRVAAGYNPTTRKMILAFNPNADASQMRVHMRNLGCIDAISMDSGGSANFKVDKHINTTTRPMMAWITWGE